MPIQGSGIANTSGQVCFWLSVGFKTFDDVVVSVIAISHFDVTLKNCHIIIVVDQLKFVFDVEICQAFCNEILTKLQPLPGHELVAEVLSGSWDFQPWLARLSASFSGIAITADELPVAHSFRFVRRVDVDLYAGSHKWSIEEDSRSLFSKKRGGLGILFHFY